MNLDLPLWRPRLARAVAGKHRKRLRMRKRAYANRLAFLFDRERRTVPLLYADAAQFALDLLVPVDVLGRLAEAVFNED